MAYKINTTFTATYDNLKSTIKSVKSEFNSVKQSAESAKQAVSNTFNQTNQNYQNMNKSIKKSTNLISTGLKASAIGVASITTPSILAGKAALNMAGQYESATQTLEYTLGEAKNIVDDFVEHNAQSIGMAKQEAYKFANIYSNLLTTMTEDQKTNAEYTNKLMQASAVIMSKTGRTFTDVADRIRSGLLGNTEAIEDLGVNVNVALLQTTDAFSKIAKGRSWDKLSFQEQQQVRLLGILEQTSKKYGEQVGDNLALKLAQTSARFQNAKTEASQFLAVGLQPLLSVINNILSGVSIFLQYLNSLDDKTKQTITTFITIAAVIPVVALVFLTLIKAINSYVMIMNTASLATQVLMRSTLGLLGSVLLLAAGIAMVAYAFGAFDNMGKNVKKTSNNTSNATKALNGLTTAADNNAESAKKASKANKELSDNLQSFDEINKLNIDKTNSGTDSGISSPGVDLSGINTGAFDNIGNQFENLNNKIQSFKEKLESAKPIIGTIGAILAGWRLFEIINGIGKMASGIKGLLPTMAASSRAGAALVTNWGAIGSAALTAGAVLFGIVAPITAIIWGINEVNKSIYQVKGATDIFKGLGNQISNTTKETVEPFVNKIKDLQYTVASIDLISGIVTDKDVATVKEKTSSIANELKENLLTKTKNISEQLNNVNLFPDPSKREKYLSTLNNSLIEEQNQIDYYESEINRIIEKASNEKRELKQEEKNQINELTREMGNTGISILSENEQEKLLLQAKFNEKYENMTKEQVVNAVAKAKELKDKSVQEAQNEYDEKVKLAETMKATVPGFTEEMYNEMLDDAKISKDNQIKEANDTYEGIVNKVKEQYPEVSKTIDFENGKALNSWQAFKITVSDGFTKIKDDAVQKVKELKEKVSTKFNEVKEDIKSSIDNATQGIKDKFNDFKSKFDPVKDWWNNKIAPWFTWEKWKNLGQNAVDGIKNAFSNMKLSFKLPHFSWTSTPASGWIANVLSALNLPTSLPKLNVSWYKKGGVFGNDSIIGVGEYAGAKSNPEIVAPQSMIYDANIKAIRDSDKNFNVSTSNKEKISKKIALEIDLTSGGVKLGKQLAELILDANDFYDLGLI